MHTVTAPKSKRIILTIKTPTVGKGHAAHRGGAGQHGDRRLKRLTTRSTILRESFRE
mgnify:CR=1 FL=1